MLPQGYKNIFIVVYLYRRIFAYLKQKENKNQIIKSSKLLNLLLSVKI